MTAELPANSSFSKLSRFLQIAVDSTSLGAFKTCPRFYYYSIIQGFQPKQESVHLTFGLHMHQGLERYHHARAQGQDHQNATDHALDFTLRATWNYELNRPWDSGDSYKNRYTLVRSLIGYLDHYGAQDPMETVILANGKPAVELSFSFEAGFSSRLTGEPFMLCGHLDRLATLNGVPYIPDVKTTKSEMNARFWSGFNPSNQFGMYLLAGQIVWKLPVQGLIVDGVQVLVGSFRFDRHLITKDTQQVQEFYQSTGWWLSQMEVCAEGGQTCLDLGEDPIAAWPMNETACSKYGGCEFQSICSRSPGSRQQWLETGFRRRVWDPLQRRGDI